MRLLHVCPALDVVGGRALVPRGLLSDPEKPKNIKRRDASTLSTMNYFSTLATLLRVAS